MVLCREVYWERELELEKDFQKIVSGQLGSVRSGRMSNFRHRLGSLKIGKRKVPNPNPSGAHNPLWNR